MRNHNISEMVINLLVYPESTYNFVWQSVLLVFWYMLNHLNTEKCKCISTCSTTTLLSCYRCKIYECYRTFSVNMSLSLVICWANSKYFWWWNVTMNMAIIFYLVQIISKMLFPKNSRWSTMSKIRVMFSVISWLSNALIWNSLHSIFSKINFPHAIILC
jgi:hypothetical protein